MAFVYTHYLNVVYMLCPLGHEGDKICIKNHLVLMVAVTRRSRLVLIDFTNLTPTACKTMPAKIGTELFVRRRSGHGKAEGCNRGVSPR